jgi:hypothetical protein
MAPRDEYRRPVFPIGPVAGRLTFRGSLDPTSCLRISCDPNSLFRLRTAEQLVPPTSASLPTGSLPHLPLERCLENHAATGSRRNDTCSHRVVQHGAPVQSDVCVRTQVRRGSVVSIVSIVSTAEIPAERACSNRCRYERLRRWFVRRRIVCLCPSISYESCWLTPGHPTLLVDSIGIEKHRIEYSVASLPRRFAIGWVPEDGPSRRTDDPVW